MLNKLFTSKKSLLSSREIERARALIVRFGRQSTSYQLLNPGITLWFSSDYDAVVGFVRRHGFVIVAGGPVCDDRVIKEVMDEFERSEWCIRQKVCYFAADESLTQALEQCGHIDRVLLGAEPVYRPDQWPKLLKTKPSLRAQLNRARNKNVNVELCVLNHDDDYDQLHDVLQQWLSKHDLPPLHFLSGRYALEDVDHRRIYVAKQDDDLVGFLVMTPVPARRGWLIEQMVRLNKAPNGTIELLIDAAMRGVETEEGHFITFGLSPLSRRSGIAQTTQSRRIKLFLRWARCWGGQYYNFDGLDAFKAKFAPARWEPVYAVAGKQRVPLRALYAIVGAFSQVSPIFFMMMGLYRGMSRGWIGLCFARVSLMVVSGMKIIAEFIQTGV